MLSSSISYASDGWEFSKESKGVTVYTREVEGSSFLEFRGEIEIDTNLSKMVSLLWTVGDMPKWMDGCLEAVVLESEAELSRKLYLRNDAPGLLKDRDLVIRNTVSQDPDSLEVTYTMDLVDEPLDTTHVHVKKMKGIVKLVPLTNNRTKVIYQAHLEPAGIVPGWAANIFVNDNPINTLKGARSILTQNSYADYPGIINYSDQ